MHAYIIYPFICTANRTIPVESTLVDSEEIAGPSVIRTMYVKLAIIIQSTL